MSHCDAISASAGLAADAAFFERVLALGECGVWVFDLATRCWQLNERAAELYANGAHGESREALLARLSHIDRLRLNLLWDALLLNGGRYDVEFALPCGPLRRWLWECAALECDGAGEPLRVIGLVQDITRRHERHQELMQRAQYDYLTGLPNRSVLDDYLQRSVQRAARRQERIAVMAIDLDRFKAINDTHGHDVGDQVLKAAAQRMQAGLRASDMVARQGGDEFIAVLVDVGHESQAGLLALRLIEEVSRPYCIDGQELRIGASIGIALLPEHGASPGSLMKCADEALYDAKRAGRVTLRFATSGLEGAEI